MIEKSGGNIYYGQYSKEVILINTLPKTIQSNSVGYLNKILPTMIDSITFSHGQIIDLKKKFEAEPKTYDLSRIIPKYELTFHLQDKSIGIKNYNLEISLDEYGQILRTNWPKETLSITNFKTLSEVEAFSLKHAKSKEINFKTYEIDLIYKEEFDKLYWIISFLVKNENGRKEFYVLEMPWNSLKISDEYTAHSSMVY